MTKKEKQRELNSGKRWRCQWKVWEGCCWHTKTGHGSQRQGQGAPLTSRHYLITDYYYLPMGIDSATSGRRGITQWTPRGIIWVSLNFGGWNRPRFPSSLSLSFSSLSLSASTLMDIFHKLLDGRGQYHMPLFSPGSWCCYLFSFLLARLTDGGRDGRTDRCTHGRATSSSGRNRHRTALACRDAQPADLIDPSLKRTYCRRGRGFPGRRAWGSGSTRKKATQPKLTTKLNKQPNMCSKLKDKLLLELPVPFVTPGATNFF